MHLNVKYLGINILNVGVIAVSIYLIVVSNVGRYPYGSNSHQILSTNYQPSTAL